MKGILLFFFLIYCTQGFSQDGKLRGSVQDAETKIQLDRATVSILSADSTLINYQLSDGQGKFNFDKLPLKKKLLLRVTYSGYLPYFSSFILGENKKTDTLAVLLAANLHTDTVVVTAAVPIRMNGDTLEINPAAFKMKEDAVVEELLNQVPGITIWSDGSITVNGKPVKSLLVDGKPFLGSTDTRVATQNLPKTAIDKIQLYQEYDRSKIGRQTQPTDSLLTMNIKLKESSKKGYFGKAGAGLGTGSRFESDLTFQAYTKKSSAGIGGGFNNINKNIANLQELFQNNTYRNFNPNLYNVGRFNAQGINKNYAIGGVYTHNFIETTNSRQNNRVSINYNASGTNSYLTDLSLQDRTTLSISQNIRDEGIQNNRNNKQDLGVSYIKTNSYNDNLSVNGAANTNSGSGSESRLSEVRDGAGLLQSTNNTNTQGTSRSDNQSLSAGFAKSDADYPLRSFNLNFNAARGGSSTETHVLSRFESITDASKNASFNRLYTNNNQSLSLGGTLDYSGFKRLLLGRYNLFGINLNFIQTFNYNKNSDNAVVGDFDSTAKRYITNGTLTNSNRRELFEYMPSLSFAKSFFKWNGAYYRNANLQFRMMEDIKTEKNQSSFARRNLDRAFRFFRFDGSVNYFYQKQQKYLYNLRLSYEKNYDYPSVNQLYTIVDDINAYDIRIGNPRLQNTTRHQFNVGANFNTQNPKSPYAVNGSVNGGYSLFLNTVTDSILNDASGKRISYYINADRSNNINLNYNLNLSRRFKKNNLQLMYDGSINSGKMPNYLDRIANTSQTINTRQQLRLQFSLGSLVIVNVAKSLQQVKAKQTVAGLQEFVNTNHITKLGLVLNYPNNFTFSSTLDNIDNSNLEKPTMLWNAFATWRFLKQQVELKFSAMDLLKQYKNITNYATAYGTVTHVTNGLQQFFLLTFSYYPRKFGKTEIKKQAVKKFEY